MSIMQVKALDVPADALSNKTAEPEQSSKNSSKWKTFAANTTLHGLRYVFHDGYAVWRRVVWFVFLCTNTCFLFYFLILSTKKFLLLPIKTVISHETPTDELVFPAVTICNLNKFMRSKINVADDDERFLKMGLNISGCIQTRAARGNLTCGQALICANWVLGSASIKGCNEAMRRNIVQALNGSSQRIFNEEEFLVRYGHEFRSMFVAFCHFQFNRVRPCSDKDFVPTLTSYGICFTFNSGYNNTPLLRSFVEGPDAGLNILLDVQTNESTVNDFSNGLKVIVHDQNTFINRHAGLNIMPGVHARVTIGVKKLVRLKAPYKTNCRDVFSPGIGSYTKDGCRFQCLSNSTINECGCRAPGLPGPDSVPVCSFQDIRCLEELHKQFNLTACHCNDACVRMVYTPTVSYSEFADISPVLEQHFGKKESYSHMRDNYVLLQVGFQHLSYEMREDVPSYGAESLFGEFGGNMGLFLGCSLLTICEFFDFFWEALKSRITRRLAVGIN